MLYSQTIFDLAFHQNLRKRVALANQAKKNTVFVPPLSLVNFSGDKMYVEPHDVARIVAREKLSLEDVKVALKGVRYQRGYDERFDYANSLLLEAGDYLNPRTLVALVRAEITEKDASLDLRENKVFFSRLVILMPTIMRFFGEDARDRNAWGIVSTIDDCHNDFHAALASKRRDRKLREVKERVMKASKLAIEAATALADAEVHFSIEFDRYRAAYYMPSDGPSRFLSDLIHELQMCSGVLEIVNATAGIQPSRLFVYGNDERTTVVEWAYHMCTMWNGPKLVTTPGSDFATLCSFLFEAVSGASDESLAGAINRYARSDARREWDRQGEEDDEDDNFESQKRAMIVSSEKIQLCKSLLDDPALSEKAIELLHLRIQHEQKRYDVAENSYGPRQIYISQMNADQWNNMLVDAVSRMKPEKMAMLDHKISSGKSQAARDIDMGQARRSVECRIDV